MAWNGKALVNGDPHVTIDTVASHLGWGAVCNGVRAGGLWTQSETSHRLPRVDGRSLCSESLHSTQNSSEGPFFSSDTHQQDGGRGYQVPHSVRSCIRTVGLVSSTYRHIPGTQNLQENQESRTVVDNSDWKLKPEIFQCIQRLWGPIEIDLSASRLSYQIPRYSSWRPDPGAEAVDAFTNWTQLRGYAIPPFALVGKCLKQVIQQVQKLGIIAPVWETQPWYPLLLQLCKVYRLRPQPVDLLTRQGEITP